MPQDPKTTRPSATSLLTPRITPRVRPAPRAVREQLDRKQGSIRARNAGDDISVRGAERNRAIGSMALNPLATAMLPHPVMMAGLSSFTLADRVTKAQRKIREQDGGEYSAYRDLKRLNERNERALGEVDSDAIGALTDIGQAMSPIGGFVGAIRKGASGAAGGGKKAQTAVDILKKATRGGMTALRREPIPMTGPFGVMTAENMGGQAGRPANNAASMIALVKSLERRGLRGVPVQGAYTDDVTGQLLKENSVLTPGASPFDMETLGRQYRQNSVITDRGLHSLGGDSPGVYPSRGVQPTKTDPYTEMPSGKRFALDLDWSQQHPLQDPAPGLAGFANQAPAIITPPSSGTVLNENNLGRIVPPGIELARVPVQYTGQTNWDLIDRLTPRFRQNYTPAALRGIKENPRSLGWYDTSELRDFFVNELGPDDGLRDFRMAMLLTSPPSAGTKVFPDNLKMGSWAYEQYKKGTLLPALQSGAPLSIPDGFRHRYQKSVNSGWKQILEDGHLDPFQQPKTMRHGEVPALGKWYNVALDRHLGRTIGEQGLLPNVKTGAYDIPGVGYPEPSWRTTGRIDTSPANSMYAGIEDGLLDESARLGLLPPQYMAAGWVGNAAETGVDDTRTLVELYNEMFRRTGRQLGVSPLDAAKGWVRGRHPLYSILGAAGVGAAGVRASEGRQERAAGPRREY